MFEITMFNFVIILYSKYNSIREIPPSNRGAGEDGGGGYIPVDSCVENCGDVEELKYRAYNDPL